MFCSNCGREGKEGELFCAGCGAPKGNNAVIEQQNVLNNQVSPVSTQPVSTKKKMPTWLTIVLVIGITVLFLVGGFVGFILLIAFSVSDYNEIYEQTEDYVYINSTHIPTVYNLMGEYELCYVPEYDYYEDSDYATYYYCDSDFDQSVMTEYLYYLIDEYDFAFYEESSTSRSVMRKEDDGSITIVKVYLYGEYIEYYAISEEMLDEDNEI